MNSPTHSSPDLTALDAITGGALTAATSGERLTRVREWLNTEPALDVLQTVFKELSARDKGAAKPVKEKIDELRRAKTQDTLAEEWAEKARALLATSRLNVADAMAWARDTAKAGAPLSREPLAGLRLALADRVKHIEDLAHRAQVLRESALLMAQRIEVLSTKPWTEALELQATLAHDIERFRQEWQTLGGDAHWQSVDPKYPQTLNESAQHIQLVWDAFSAALAQTQAAAHDASLPLPAVPAWADQLRQSRGEAVKAAPAAPARAPVDPALREQAQQTVQELLQQLEAELLQGHSKATTTIAAALKQALKIHAKALDHELDTKAQQALTKAAELEGWQRWRADQIRTELVTKAEALLKPLKPLEDKTASAVEPSNASDDVAVSVTLEAEAAVSVTPEAEAAPLQALPQAEATTDAPAPVSASEATAETSTETPTETSAEAQAPVKVRIKGKGKSLAAAQQVTEWVPVVTGRKLQDSLRQLREAWKQTDQGGQPNHALWKRFDQACNRAYPFVQEWLEKAKAESQAHRDQRLALLAEVAAWTVAHAGNTDWKQQARELHQFSERWRTSGHLSEKAFAEMQAQWKSAMSAAHAELEQAENASIARRRSMIEEAKQLAAAASLRIDAVKALQQRWQAESQSIALDRKLAQKLWDAFRQPLDEAFQRKTQERTVQTQALSAHDQAVLDASNALEKAIAQGDAALIRQAMQHLNLVITGKAVATAVSQESRPVEAEASPVEDVPATETAVAEQSTEVEPSSPDTAADQTATDETQADTQAADAPAPAPVKTPAPAKKVVAVRGDDRPGQKKTEPVVAGRFGDKPGARRNERDAPGRRNERDAPGRGREREPFVDRGPRLGDAAFRAQRNAIEQAENVLKKLAMQAHGETLVHVLSAWQQRQADQLPPAKELGSRVNAAQRQAWVQALQTDAKGDAATALLRLEMAAEVNTPADHQQARRNLQLQLLTKRNDAPPAQTWAQDVASVLQSGYDADAAQRVQTVLRVLLKR